MNIIKKPIIAQDSIKQPYLVIDFDYYEIEPLISLFREKVENYSSFEEFKRNRDGKKYHLTILSAPEYGRLSKDPVQLKNITEALNKEFSLHIKGIGYVKKQEQEAFYGVIESVSLNAFRNSLTLSDKDLHITLGFLQKDIHFDENKKPIRKNITIWDLEPKNHLKP